MTEGFANQTTVAPEKTRAEIEATLKRYKADSFLSGWDDKTAFVAFQANGRLIRFKIAVPVRTDPKFTHVDKWNKRPESKAQALYEQAIRTIWRRLLLCIKAKLESVASGIETFETAFAAHIVIPGTNQTVGEWMGPQIAAAYAGGPLPKCLPNYVGGDAPQLPPPSGGVTCAKCGIQRAARLLDCPACGSKEIKP